MVPQGLLWSVVAQWETLVLKEPTPEALQALVLVSEVSGADGASLGATSIEVDGAGPQPSDDTESSLQELVMRGSSFSVPKSAAPDDAAPTPGSPGAMCLGVSRLILLGSPGFLSPPINWRWVEDNAEFACSHVTATERLLHETLALVGRNILRPIQVSLKKRVKLVCAPLAFFNPAHPLLCSFL
jgi:hypothetical protein